MNSCLYTADPQSLLWKTIRSWLLGLLTVLSLPANAFPDKPVRLIVPYAVGGSSDVVARVLSVRLAEVWGQPVVVENLPGGGSVFGTQAVARAAPDGHTLLAGSIALAINEALSRKLPYHALRDFAPIALAARQHIALVVSASSSLTTVAHLRDAARGKPGLLSYGTAGNGVVGHLAGELLKLLASINLNHVAYNGNKQAASELIAQHVSCAWLPLPSVMPYVKSGRLRVVAVAESRRAAALPDTPTVGETISGYEVSNWIGVLAPYGASVQLVRRINADVSTIANKPEYKDLLATLGYEAAVSTPGEFHTRLAADIERYSRIAISAGLAQ